MKILFLLEIPGVSPYHTESAVGGVCNSICKDLTKLGHTVYVEGKPFDTHKKIKSLSIPVPEDSGVFSKLKKWLSNSGLLNIYKKRRADKALKSGISALKILSEAETKPDLIISWVGLKASLGSDFKTKWNIPLISIYDNPLLEEYRFLHGYPPFNVSECVHEEKKILSDSDVVVVYSTNMIEELRKKIPSIKKFSIQQFTIDDLMIKEQSSNVASKNVVNLIYVGSFLPWHNIPEMIRLFNQLAQQESKEIYLHMVGKGMTFSACEKLISELNIGDRIKLYGYLDGEKMSELLIKMDIGIIPGCLWFHAPVKFMQYSSAGIPVIAPSTPTLKEMSHNSDAVFLFNDLNEIVGIIHQLINSKENNSLAKNTIRELYLSNFSSEAKQLFWKNLIGEIV